MRLLVVEDESLLRQQLVMGLQRAGYVVDDAADGKSGLFQALEVDYDAAIIDLGLPQLDGISLIRKLRETGKRYPVLILTARGDWQDKVAGLDAGADDYVVKPFRIEEIQARLNALLRRAAGFASPQINAGPICLDTSSKRVTVHGKEVDLTAYEYKTLEYLMLHLIRLFPNPNSPITFTRRITIVTAMCWRFLSGACARNWTRIRPCSPSTPCVVRVTVCVRSTDIL